MQVDAWMTRHVHSAKPLDSIQHARETMEAHRINQLPVVTDHGVVGIITDRDLRDAFPSVFDSASLGTSRKGKVTADPKTIMVESVMTPNVVILGPTDSIVDAARLMRRERIGAIPIVQGNHLVGILTRSDLLDAFVALVESGSASPPAKSSRA